VTPTWLTEVAGVFTGPVPIQLHLFGGPIELPPSSISFLPPRHALTREPTSHGAGRRESTWQSTLPGLAWYFRLESCWRHYSSHVERSLRLRCVKGAVLEIVKALVGRSYQSHTDNAVPTSLLFRQSRERPASTGPSTLQSSRRRPSCRTQPSCRHCRSRCRGAATVLLLLQNEAGAAAASSP
jgi:hypothetical protein